jgi:homospermidine synthase
VNFQVGRLLKDNYTEILDPLLGPGDFLLNVSVDVGSCDLMEFCNERDVMYLDTVVEPWLGGYTDMSLTPSQRSNYAQREEMLDLKRKFGPDSVTVITSTTTTTIATTTTTTATY